MATRKDADVAAMETKVSEAIGCPVSIDSNESGGWSLSLKTFSLDEFDGVLERLIRKPSE